jgi:putative RecB family exonuclease
MKPKNVFLTHLSYSSIDAYTTCQKSWYYRYVEKVPGPVSPDLVFGTAFHKAVERHIQSGENKMSLHQLWFHCWAETVKENDSIAWDKDESYYEALGASMLIHDESIRAIESIKPLLVHGSKPAIETKVEFEVPGVPIPIIGYIDLIEEDGTPGDFKTSARPWSQRRADKEFQPEFYLS